jgi:hypothetical protein
LKKLSDERTSAVARLREDMEKSKQAKMETEVSDGDDSGDDGFPASDYVDMEAVRVNSDDEDLQEAAGKTEQKEETCAANVDTQDYDSEVSICRSLNSLVRCACLLNHLTWPNARTHALDPVLVCTLLALLGGSAGVFAAVCSRALQNFVGFAASVLYLLWCFQKTLDGFVEVPMETKLGVHRTAPFV